MAASKSQVGPEPEQRTPPINEENPTRTSSRQVVWYHQHNRYTDHSPSQIKLPLAIRGSITTTQFKSRLKTHLFKTAYND